MAFSMIFSWNWVSCFMIIFLFSGGHNLHNLIHLCHLPCYNCCICSPFSLKLPVIFSECFLSLQLKNLSAMEANIVRPFVTSAMQTFYKLSSPEMIQDSDSISNRQPQTTDRGPRVSTFSYFLIVVLFIPQEMH